MNRFDSNRFPDRFAVEAYARKLRAQELGRLSRAAGARLAGWSRNIASSLRRLGAHDAVRAHRESVH